MRKNRPSEKWHVLWWYLAWSTLDYSLEPMYAPLCRAGVFDQNTQRENIEASVHAIYEERGRARHVAHVPFDYRQTEREGERKRERILKAGATVLSGLTVLWDCSCGSAADAAAVAVAVDSAADSTMHSICSPLYWPCHWTPCHSSQSWEFRVVLAFSLFHLLEM